MLKEIGNLFFGDYGKAAREAINLDKGKSVLKYQNFFESIDGVLSSTDRLKLWQKSLEEEFPGNKKINPSKIQCSKWNVDDLSEAIFLKEYSPEGRKIGETLIEFSKRIDKDKLEEVRSTVREIFFDWEGKKEIEEKGLGKLAIHVLAKMALKHDLAAVNRGLISPSNSLLCWHEMSRDGHDLCLSGGDKLNIFVFKKYI